MASDERDEAEEGYGCCGGLLVSTFMTWIGTSNQFLPLNFSLW